MYSYVVPISAATNNDTIDNDNSTINDTTSDDINNGGTTTTNDTIGNETISNSTAADDATVNPNNEDNVDQERNDNRRRYVHAHELLHASVMHIHIYRSDS